MAQIALTTVFTPPASCLDNSYTSYAASVYVKDVKVQASACYPEGFQSLWSLGEPFSPGVCPESYAAVSSSTTKGGKSGRDETRVLCCPGSMTARGAELGCYTDVEDETVLALPTGVVTVEGALLAIHGILVAWASSDLAVLPAVPGSLTTTTGPCETHASSTAQRVASITPPASSAALVSSATSTHTMTITPSVTMITEATTQKAESQISDPTAGDATPMAQETSTPEAFSTPPPESTTSISTSPSSSIPTTHFPPSTIAGIGIGAAASLAILAGLIAWAIVFRRRRRRRSNGVDSRGFDSAAEFHGDKRRWSGVSDSFGTASYRGSGSGSGRGRTEVSEADSRAVFGAVSCSGSGSGCGRTDVSEAHSRAVLLGAAELEGE